MKSWPEFLRSLSAKLFEEADETELELVADEAPELSTSKWLGFPGATEEAIAAREAALGARLPDDYRAFLLASNGFRGLADLPHGLCSLLPIEEIGWMRDVDAEIGRLASYVEQRTSGAKLSGDFDVDPDDFARTLLIGESDGNECILLLPPTGDGPWEVWTYHPETGFSTGDTFEEFMEAALEA